MRNGSTLLTPYLRASLWFLLSLVISSCNDLVAKLLVSNLHPVQISFLRFFFSSLVLLPIMLYYGRKSFQTPHLGLHVIRGALLCGGIILWILGLSRVHMAAATLVSFSIPLFVLVLSGIFLKESVGWSRWIATCLGFVGVIIIVGPDTSGAFDPVTLSLILAAVLFASLDVMNKLVVVKGETMLSMLFYSALATTVLTFPALFFYWEAPTTTELLLGLCLGIGANLILYCLLRAFSLADASAIAPLRYIEFLLAAAFSYIVFAELPTDMIYYGAAIIIPATLFIVYYEGLASRRNKAKGANG